MKTENNVTIPMDLQLFAEQPADPDTQQPEPEVTDPDTQQPEPEVTDPDTQQPESPTIEEAMAQTATERAEKERTKVALDKALKEVGELKKALRQKMTAQEKEDEAKREQEEQHKAYVASLEEFKHKTEAKDRYLMQGMPVDIAEKAAKAEVEGDMEALTNIQKQHTDALLKAQEKEWKKSTGGINAGIDGEFSVTKEQFRKMGYKQRVELKQKNPELYKKFTE